MNDIYDTPDCQIHDSQDTIQSDSNSPIQEGFTQFKTLSRQQTNTSAANSSRQNEQQQSGDVTYCHCGLESILRVVKINSENQGRSFWSCQQFGGPNHSKKCNFFKWATDRNKPSDDDSEINLSPHSDNEVIIVNRPIARNRTTIDTPPSRNRNYNRRNSFPQAHRRSQYPSSNNMHKTDTRNLTGDIYTRNPTVFGNWSNVPKYSTPQILDIVQNHLVQQDKNCQSWFTGARSAEKEFEEAKKEVERLKNDLEIMVREKDLCKRENDILEGEKRLLERENGILKEENQKLKRMRH